MPIGACNPTRRCRDQCTSSGALPTRIAARAVWFVARRAGCQGRGEEGCTPLRGGRQAPQIRPRARAPGFNVSDQPPALLWTGGGDLAVTLGGPSLDLADKHGLRPLGGVALKLAYPLPFWVCPP